MPGVELGGNRLRVAMEWKSEEVINAKSMCAKSAEDQGAACSLWKSIGSIRPLPTEVRGVRGSVEAPRQAERCETAAQRGYSRSVITPSQDAVRIVFLRCLTLETAHDTTTHEASLIGIFDGVCCRCRVVRV